MGFGGGILIGRIRGIEIRVHWSWIFIGWLVTWVVGAEIIPEFQPGIDDALRWTLAVIASLLFFSSVLLHELSHSVVAQRYGMRVPSITLFVFGGVSSLGEEMKTAKQEFRVAIAGPLMSWVLAAIFGALWVGLRTTEISVVPGYLALVNFALGAFNLLPGFPLDGGRVFRSIIWGRTNDLVKATRVASLVGSGIAYLLIALGLVNIFALGLFGGIWYVLIGFFLLSASQGSYRSLVVERALKAVTARTAMRPPPDPIEGAMTLQQFVDRYLLVTGEHCYLVGTNGAVVGLITPSDLTGVPREEWGVRTVERAMVPSERVITIDPEADLVHALDLMREHDIHQLPVLEEGRLIGVLTRGDVMRQIELRTQFVEPA